MSKPTAAEYFAVPYCQRGIIFGDQPQFERREPARHIPLTLDRPSYMDRESVRSMENRTIRAKENSNEPL